MPSFFISHFIKFKKMNWWPAQKSR
uniref:Uncharacterized protein n=1 Tax=Rhizophora mucronata TaxID=61149 RepID=A0A2P2R5D6_RHIMU